MEREKNMADFLILGILLLLVGLAVRYIIKAKKNGTKCIGCPSSGQCGTSHGCSCGGSCGCGHNIEE